MVTSAGVDPLFTLWWQTLKSRRDWPAGFFVRRKEMHEHLYLLPLTVVILISKIKIIIILR